MIQKDNYSIIHTRLVEKKKKELVPREKSRDL